MAEILAFRINFSRFKDILDLLYMGIFLTIMFKKHTDIETKVLGKKCILDMHVCGNFVTVYLVLTLLGGGEGGECFFLYLSCLIMFILL